MTPIRIALLLFFATLLYTSPAIGQACTALGQTPATAFPVCGTTAFQQNNVPICSSNDIFVPGCSNVAGAALYQNKNPFYYKFTCYVSGTLAFLITPSDLTDDYDWQLYDVTGHNPNDIFTDNSLVVTGNWSGSSGTTGASSTGVPFIQCASVPDDNKPTFSAMPNLIAGHDYLLMISHYTNSQSGYSLSFGGGTGIITDPLLPHLKTAKADCDGKKITLKLNKKMKCTSLTGNGSEFSIVPAAATVISATAFSCSAGFDMDSVEIVLSNALPSNTYQLVINDGADGNTLLDNCDHIIPVGEKVSFIYALPQPTPIDSIGRIGCKPDEVLVYFGKKIDCASIAADGSDFIVTGLTPVTVISANGNCVAGKTDFIHVKFSAPIYTQGVYTLQLAAGSDGTTVIDECGQQTLPQTKTFTTADTVSPRYTYTSKMGCRADTLTFTHDGAHNVDQWNWLFNNTAVATTPSCTIIFAASSTNSIKLKVSNGVCTDSATTQIVLNNEVKASFEMPTDICPGDRLIVKNTSTGVVTGWNWQYDVFGSSSDKDPPPYLFPDNNNREVFAGVKLFAINSGLNCSDSAKKYVRILNNCFIAVPTAFTPNGDGVNDYFSPHNALKATNLDFKVYNRWGQLVFHSTDWKQRWDGKVGGLLQNTGVYVWMLSYTNTSTQQPVFQKGTVTLIR